MHLQLYLIQVWLRPGHVLHPWFCHVKGVWCLNNAALMACIQSTGGLTITMYNPTTVSQSPHCLPLEQTRALAEIRWQPNVYTMAWLKAHSIVVHSYVDLSV